MSKVDLVVIALPSGRGTVTGPGGTMPIGRCTALFAPRLRVNGTLNNYATDWKDWPAALAARNVQAFIDGVPVPTVRTSTPSSAMWRAVFPPTTEVRRHVFIDRQTSTVSSFKGATLDNLLRDLYRAAVTKFPDGPPSAAEIVAIPSGQALLDLPASGDPATPMSEALDVADVQGDGLSDTSEDPEFHEWLGLLSSHPALLRQLGLALDLQIDLTGIAAFDHVQVMIDYGALVDRRVMSPSTKLTPTFLALADPDPIRNELKDGWLRCGDPRYATAQVDALESALTLLSVAEGHGDGLPVQRFAGVSLVRDDHAELVQARILRSAAIEDEIERFFEGALVNPPLLFAEDITLGYRFEVLDAGVGPWRSLQQRTATGPYDLPRAPLLSFTPPPDEGTTTWTLSTEGHETVTQSAGFGGVGENGPKHPHQNRSGTFRADPVVLTWYGWSIIVPRPGSVLDPATGLGVPAPVKEPDTTQDVQLAIEHEVTAATLPKLRFGHSYQFRARAVDMAGGSLPFQAAAVNPVGTTSVTERFGRTEVVDAPSVLRRSPHPDPGVFDTTTTIVLLSDFDIPDATVPIADRMLFPPEVGQYTCELHDLPNGGADPAAYADLAARDALSIELMGHRDATTGELLWTGPSRPLVTYLVDPVVDGVGFQGVPGTTVPVVVPWEQPGWPVLRAGRLQVKAGSGAPSVRPTADTLLRILLPKAADVIVPISSSIDPTQVSDFEHFDELAAADQAAVEASVQAGQHWMFSPATALRLVHAVRRPLLRPELLGFTATRSPGATSATLDGPVALSGASTGALVARATWIETIDDLEAAAPVPHNRGARSRTNVGTSDQPDVTLLFSLGSTKRAELTVEADAVSRFVDFFTERVDTILTGTTLVVLDPAGVVASTVVVTKGDGTIAEQGAAYRLDADAGTIRRLVGGGIADGSSVSVAFVARPVIRSSTEGVAGARVNVVVPSSVPPPPPVIHEVVPSSVETTTTTATKVTRQRKGRAVRVWLDRPWLSSGDGEQLAVVLPASLLGRDPLSRALGGPALMSTAHIPSAAATVTDLEGTGIDLALHNVTFDAGRGRWFADVRLDGVTRYRPWLRLAVARYQPDAIAGAHLSAVVDVAEMRLGVDRTVVVQLLAGSRLKVTVTGEDHLGIAEGGGDGLNQITVLVQRADPVITDPILRWIDVDTEAALTHSAFGTWRRTMSFTPSADALRLLLIEREPALEDPGGVVTRHATYVETIDLPSGWTTP